MSFVVVVTDNNTKRIRTIFGSFASRAEAEEWGLGLHPATFQTATLETWEAMDAGTANGEVWYITYEGRKAINVDAEETTNAGNTDSKAEGNSEHILNGS